MSKRPADEENVCSFYLQRKKRPCRMKRAEGMKYCPHHSYLGTEKDEKRGARIPCPLDPAHFCYESKLQKHLKKCNAREKDKPKYFIENINSCGDKNSEDTKVSLNDITDDELLQLIEKIKMLHEESSIVIHENNTMHPLLQDEMEKQDDGFNSFKHMKQQASLLSLMEDHGFLSDHSCFIEFGAGRGQLMYWVVKCVPETEKCIFLLIDRSTQRHKSDNKFKGTDLQIERIRIDIQHLHLGRIDSVKPKINKVVGISKHLCGCATDLALRCLTRTLETEADNQKSSHRALGLVMALCCHHRCTWNSYVGKDFMQIKGISEKEFKLMCCIASWATCGRRKTDPKKKDNDKSNVDTHEEDDKLNENASLDEDKSNGYASQGDDVSHADVVQDEKLLNRYEKLNLKHEQREEIGLQCKRLIDAGRADYLKQHGYEVKLVSYIDKCISLENVALIAFHKSS